MKRGDVITISTRGAARKPRPAIVVEEDEFVRHDRPLLVCPLTSKLADAPLLRIDLHPSVSNQLRVPSQVMIDRLSSALSKEIGTVIGRIGDDDILRIDLALTNILGLSSAVAAISGLGGNA